MNFMINNLHGVGVFYGTDVVAIKIETLLFTHGIFFIVYNIF